MFSFWGLIAVVLLAVVIAFVVVRARRGQVGVKDLSSWQDAFKRTQENRAKDGGKT